MISDVTVMCFCAFRTTMEATGQPSLGKVPPQVGGSAACGSSELEVVVAGVCYLLVLPAVGDKDVVPHLHGQVQPGEGVTHSHPQRRGIAGHRCHGSHFLPPVVSSSTLWEGGKKVTE